jgi:hypothetical protein
MKESKDMGSANASRAAMGPLPHVAPEAEPSAAFTPGPWAVEGDFLVTLDPIENEYERRAISDLRYWHMPRNEANARLAAAAPDLLEALQLVLASLANGSFPPGMYVHARAAIAKALGPSTADTSEASDEVPGKQET